jgi:hypothetical protein
MPEGDCGLALNPSREANRCVVLEIPPIARFDAWSEQIFKK